MRDWNLENANAAQQSAWQLWQHYDFKKAENWRWTPSEALFKSREALAADYQFSLAEGVQDDWGEDAIPQDLAQDLPLAHANYALLNQAFKLHFQGEYDEISHVLLEGSASAWQSSRLQCSWAEASRAPLWLHYSLKEQAAQNGVIQLQLAAKAEAEVVLWLEGAAESTQTLTLLIEQEAASSLRLNVVQTAGSALQRVDLRHRLRGEEAQFILGGVQALQGHEVADIHAVIRHEAAHCNSQQIIRGALTAQSIGIFDGMIYVTQDAQKTDAQQDSRYVLQEQARAQSMPRLEIYADDVQCAHGSTTGAVDEEALFYLQSRGISQDAARRLLLHSFLQEAVVVEHEALRALLIEQLNAEDES